MFYYHVGRLVQPGIPDTLGGAPPLSRFAFYFTSGGLWNSLVHWIREDADQTPEALTEYILQTFRGIAGYMDETNCS